LLILVLTKCIASFCTHPLDVVRTKLAVERWRSTGIGDVANGANGNVNRNGRIPPPRYSGTWGTLSTVAREEGMKGLFRGLSPALVVNAPAAAMFFGAYKSISAAAASSGYSESFSSALGGASGWIATCLAFNPLYVLKTKQQTQLVRNSGRLKYVGLWSSTKVILAEQGVRGLYVGTVAACAGFPGAMVQMPLYEHLKGDGSNTVRVAGASAFSSAFVGLIAYPLEVVRLRLQAQGPPSRRTKGEVHYSGLIDGFRKIYNSEGIAAFYRGCGTALIRTVPQSAIALATFETILTLVNVLTDPV